MQRMSIIGVAFQQGPSGAVQRTDGRGSRRAGKPRRRLQQQSTWERMGAGPLEEVKWPDS